MEALTPDDVQQALKDKGLDIQVRHFETSTATSQEAADSIGTTLGSIVKSLVFVINGEPLVVLTAGDQWVDTRKIAAVYDVGRKKVKTAKPEECIAHVGYAPGGVPPLGHRETVTIWIDESLSRFETVYAAAGSPNSIFAISYQRLVEITDGRLMDVIKED